MTFDVAIVGYGPVGAVPDLAEKLPGFEMVGWFAVVAPAGTPATLIDPYSQAIAKVVRSGEFGTRLANLGLTATPSTPAELGARLRATQAAWRTMVENAGFQPQ